MQCNAMLERDEGSTRCCSEAREMEVWIGEGQAARAAAARERERERGEEGRTSERRSATERTRGDDWMVHHYPPLSLGLCLPPPLHIEVSVALLLSLSLNSTLWFDRQDTLRLVWKGSLRHDSWKYSSSSVAAFGVGLWL